MEFENLFERAADSESMMDRESVQDIVSPMAQALPEGYWFSEEREENGTMIFEFITVEGEGPKIEIHVKQGD